MFLISISFENKNDRISFCFFFLNFLSFFFSFLCFLCVSSFFLLNTFLFKNEFCFIIQFILNCYWIATCWFWSFLCSLYCLFSFLLLFPFGFCVQLHTFVVQICVTVCLTLDLFKLIVSTHQKTNKQQKQEKQTNCLYTQ